MSLPKVSQWELAPTPAPFLFQVPVCLLPHVLRAHTLSKPSGTWLPSLRSAHLDRSKVTDLALPFQWALQLSSHLVDTPFSENPSSVTLNLPTLLALHLPWGVHSASITGVFLLTRFLHQRFRSWGPQRGLQSLRILFSLWASNTGES